MISAVMPWVQTAFINHPVNSPPPVGSAFASRADLRLQQLGLTLRGRGSVRQAVDRRAHQQGRPAKGENAFQESELLEPGHSQSEHAEHSEDQEWTWQQLISLISGFLGGLLSINTYNLQREEVKRKSSSFRSLKQRRSSRPSSPRSGNVVQQLGGSLLEAEAESPLFILGSMPACTPASSLRSPGRHFTIVTTASLPWRTGTAVNPLLRALYLAKSGRPTVLALPFMQPSDQEPLFGRVFQTPAEQEENVREWCRERAKINPDKIPLKFRWYPAKYVPAVCSIFPSGDASTCLDENDPKDVLIMEEPEHLCWYHHGQRWPDLFKHVVGILHTNYADYMEVAGDKQGGSVPLGLKEASVFASSTLVCGAYCDVNIKLSDTIQPLPNEVVCNVHGVREEFLKIGDQRHMTSTNGPPVYFLGKALMEKGWRELLQIFRDAGSEFSDLVVDGYGSGNDYDNIVREAAALRDSGGVHLEMHPGRDHADKQIHGYGVLVNPSTSDVLCTVTVEALAMGKQCVLARHVSNQFFEQFADRCHYFEVGDTQSFVRALRTALSAGNPSPLPPEQRQILTWDAANERLFECAEIRVLSGALQRPSETPASRLSSRIHYDIFSEKSGIKDVIKEATLGEKAKAEEESIADVIKRAALESYGEETVQEFDGLWDRYQKQWRRASNRTRHRFRELRREAKRMQKKIADRADGFLS